MSRLSVQNAATESVSLPNAYGTSFAVAPGECFIVTLLPRGISLNSHSHQRNRVLLIDDDVAVQGAFRRLLENAGFDVATASDGEAGLATLRRDPSVAVVLLDLQMPGMGGVAVRRAQLADAVLALIPTIIVSGSGEAFVGDHDLQADAYLHKPVTRLELIAAVSRYCTPLKRAL